QQIPMNPNITGQARRNFPETATSTFQKISSSSIHSHARKNLSKTANSKKIASAPINDDLKLVKITPLKKKFKCSHCNMVGEKRSTIKAHFSVAHPQMQCHLLYQCILCEHNEKCNRQLDAHYAT